MVIGHLALYQGYAPPWWYGYAHSRINTRECVYYPVGIHLVVRLGIRLKHAYDLWRNRPPEWVRVEDHAEAVAERVRTAEARGYQCGRNQADSELLTSRIAAWEHGYQSAFDALYATARGESDEGVRRTALAARDRLLRPGS